MERRRAIVAAAVIAAATLAGSAPALEAPPGESAVHTAAPGFFGQWGASQLFTGNDPYILLLATPGANVILGAGFFALAIYTKRRSAT